MGLNAISAPNFNDYSAYSINIPLKNKIATDAKFSQNNSCDMKIYDATGKLFIDIEVDDTSYRYRTIGGEHNLILKYSLPQHIELPVGAYVVFETQTYVLKRPQDFKMKFTRAYEYTVTFETPQSDAKIWKFRNPVDGRLKFSLTATPREHLEMFVANMNRRDAGWTIGECIEGTEKCINYDHDYCWDAIGKMASEFNTEFEIKDKQVSLHKVEYNKSNPLPLSYGCGNGFQSGVGRSNSGDKPPIEILYVQGGTRNIDPSKYENKELLLPKNQTIRYDGEHFEDEEGFNNTNARNYVVDDLGFSIRRADKNLSSLAEDSLDASEIYPKRVGTISQWITVDMEGNLYDFTDNTIPSDLNYEDYLIEGETMTVIFQSGMLAGKEFEVKYYHDPINNKYDTSKNKVGRRFEILPQDIDGETMPNDIFKAAINDTYAVFNCALPDSYICDNNTKTGASWDMFREAVKYLYDNEEEKYTFSGTLDGLWAKKDWLNIGGKIILGGFVKFFDNNFLKEGVLVRIVGIKDFINNPHSPSIELSNETRSASFGTKMGELVAQEVEIEENYKAAVRFTKRRWQDAKETVSMLEKALLDNFTNSINPIAVETMSVLVGDESLQFRFVNNIVNPQTVNHIITYNSDELQLNAPAGIIQHMTLDIDTISSDHKPSEYKFWNVEQFSSAHLTDGSKSYYLYIKANRNNDSAVFELSETAHKMGENASVYYFLVGVLNKEFDGERSFVTLYGFTEILPGRVTTDKVVSSDGNSFFDLVANAMKLGDRLIFNTNGDGQLLLKGTMVQSQSGATEYLGCYRGIYNSASTYYQGDEVVYTNNNLSSYYRYINPEPKSNIPPTNTLYWQIIAEGSKGDDGANGNYTELQFAKNGSPTEPPKLDKQAVNPQGWSIDMTKLNDYPYLWMTKAVKSGKDNSLIGEWSDPVRMTGEKGEDGKDGYSPALVFRGEYKNNEIYYGNKNRLDCVKYTNVQNGQEIVRYFISRIDAPNGGGGYQGIVPTNSEYWNDFGATFDSIATGLLLAENANIANLIFRNQRLESYASVGGKPNFYIDGLKNEASFAAGNIFFKYDSAKIGWLNVIEQDLIGYDEEGRERVRITSNGLPDLSATDYTSRLTVVDTNKGSCDSVADQQGEVTFYGSGFYVDERDGQSKTDMSGSFSVEIPNDYTSINFDIRCGAFVTNSGFNVSAYVLYNISHESLGIIDTGRAEAQETHNIKIVVPKKGKIQISFTAYMSYPTSFYGGIMDVNFSPVTASSEATGIIIARDGFAAVYNGNYLRMSPSAFDVRFGNYRFKIDSTGMKKSSDNGGSWNNI